ncbi:MAG: hypothetical protein AAB463_00465 [Patescibacteria group bacterium]
MASSQLIFELTDTLITLGSLARDMRAAKLIQEPTQRLTDAVSAHAHNPTQDSYIACARVTQEVLERIALCEASEFCTPVDAARYTRAILTLRALALALVPHNEARSIKPSTQMRSRPIRVRSVRPMSGSTASNGEQRYGDILSFIREHPNVALNEVIRALPKHSRRTVQRAVRFLVREHVVQRMVNGKSVSYAIL